MAVKATVPTATTVSNSPCDLSLSLVYPTTKVGTKNSVKAEL